VDLAEATLSRGLALGWQPDPILTVSEWADQHRVLVAETTRQHGSWRTDRTPYLREIMDCLSSHSTVRHVAFMKGAQIGGTEMGLNWLGYIIHNSPNPTMAVYPRIEDAEDVSKDRVSTMIAAAPELETRVRENRSRDSGNTILKKVFRGGFIKFSGANSAASLRSKPICNLFRDEIDAFPDDVDGEGDPLALSEERTNTYSRKKKILDVSTPTIKDVSKIEKQYRASDQRRYFIPCPSCGHMDFLTFRDVGHHRIEFDEAHPELAHMVCAGCGAKVEEHHKSVMLAGGEWRATAQSDGRIRGYHLSALYSPIGWLSWEEVVRRFLAAKDDTSKLKVWVNTCMGEAWEEKSDGVNASEILNRRETYPADIPNGVGALTMSVDVQGDRLEWKIKGWGAGEESWLIQTAAIPGDPDRAEVWKELDQVRHTAWRHESGQEFKPDICVIDSGGHHTDQVYKYARERAHQGVYAIRGGNTQGQPLVGRSTVERSYRGRLWTLCVDTGKETVYARLRISKPGPGYMHMPDWIEQDYVDQLTAERSYRKYVRGRGSVRVWAKLGDRRNEALDLEVYALAALYMRGQPFVRALGERASRWAQPVLGLGEGGQPPAQAQHEAAPAHPDRRPATPRPRGWTTGWRK